MKNYILKRLNERSTQIAISGLLTAALSSGGYIESNIAEALSVLIMVLIGVTPDKVG